MKTRLFISALITLLSVAVYPFTEQLANAERGCADCIDNVFGGEEMLLIFGLFVSLLIVVEGVDKLLFPEHKKRSNNQRVAASQTESEQSESKSL